MSGCFNGLGHAASVSRTLAAQGIHVSRKRVARIMRQERLRARPRERFKCTTMSDHDQPVAANVLDRRFEDNETAEKE